MASPSRAYYSDEDYSARYDSDDFASDDDIVSIRQTSSYTSKPPSKKASPYTIPNRGKRNKGRGRGQTGSKQNTPQPVNTVAKRMLSASRIRMNEYRNQIEELNSRIRDLAEENKTLKKMQFRHQKALGKFEEQESELPVLLTKHSNEVRTLREQTRAWKEKFHKNDRYLRDAEDELESTKAQLKKYKKLCSQKGLKEREELHREVLQSEIRVEEKDSRIKELQRHIEALNKNHRHEMGIELAHHRETKKQLKLLEEKQTGALMALREKEKELEIKNIYSNRLMKASPKHHASYNGTPQHTPPPGRKKRIPSLTDLTSREKIKLYEGKRKIDEKKKSESPRHKSRDFWSEKEEVSKEPLKNKRVETEEEADLWIQREHSRIKLEKEEQDKRKLLEEERIKKNEEQEKERRLREEEERESRWREEMERESLERKRKEEERERLEQQERLDREQRVREEEERRRKEEERNQHLEEEKRKIEREAKLLEIEAEEERRRLEIDPRTQEERKKKDMLLAKLKQMDNSETTTEPVSVKAESPQRATFITSNTAYSPGLDSNYSTKSNYSFTKPTENLHHGLPSHDDVTVPYLEKQRNVKSKKEEQEVGGYQPSFTSNVFNSDNLKAPLANNNKAAISKNNDMHRTTMPASSERKAKLLNDLFGKKAEDSISNEDIGVKEKVGKSSVTKTSPFPWDNVESKSKNNSATKRENSSTLFGGGSALIEFDDGFDNSATKLLPKRSQHSTTTFSSKPTVNAIDNLDDDIEEVML